jgi:hypothetical protein
LTYNGQGCAKPGIIKWHHAACYSSRDGPQLSSNELPAAGERPLLSAIQVRPKYKVDKLDTMARINYGKMYTIEHNIKVCEFGVVHERFIPLLKSSWSWVLGRDLYGNLEEEDEDQEEARDSANDEEVLFAVDVNKEELEKAKEEQRRIETHKGTQEEREPKVVASCETKKRERTTIELSSEPTRDEGGSGGTEAVRSSETKKPESTAVQLLDLLKYASGTRKLEVVKSQETKEPEPRIVVDSPESDRDESISNALAAQVSKSEKHPSIWKSEMMEAPSRPEERQLARFLHQYRADNDSAIDVKTQRTHLSGAPSIPSKTADILPKTSLICEVEEWRQLLAEEMLSFQFTSISSQN